MEPIDVEKDSLCSPKCCWWLQDLNLEVSDRIAIVTGKELSEKTINASMSILSRQYPDIGGLQDCTFGHYLNYTLVRTTNMSVQIFHTGKNKLI